MTVSTVLFANPTAQSGAAEDWIKDARALLDAAGISHRFIATQPEGGTVELCRAAIDGDGVRRVIYMGGDGTFADVAKGVLASAHAPDVDMGMLPMGTANDQGKSFGLSAGRGALADNIAVIAVGATVDIDVGRIRCLDDNGDVIKSDLFFDSASIGFNAATLAIRNRDRETTRSIPVFRQIYRDHLVYAGAIVKRLLGTVINPYATFDLDVDIDGTRYHYESLIDVIIKNTHVFAGEWVLAPDAEVDDGLFELVPVAGVVDFTSKLLATLRHSPVDEQDLARLGIHLSKPVPGASFDLTIHQPGADSPPPSQIDGEEFANGYRFRVDVLQRVLHIIVPRQHRRQPGT